jgi:hypothetical protein
MDKFSINVDSEQKNWIPEVEKKMKVVAQNASQRLCHNITFKSTVITMLWYYFDGILYEREYYYLTEINLISTLFNILIMNIIVILIISLAKWLFNSEVQRKDKYCDNKLVGQA